MALNIDGSAPCVLKHDGVEKFRGTCNECLMKLHRLQGQSWDWAMKYEGWTIEEVLDNPSTK